MATGVRTSRAVVFDGSAEAGADVVATVHAVGDGVEGEDDLGAVVDLHLGDLLLGLGEPRSAPVEAAAAADVAGVLEGLLLVVELVEVGEQLGLSVGEAGGGSV